MLLFCYNVRQGSTIHQAESAWRLCNDSPDSANKTEKCCSFIYQIVQELCDNQGDLPRLSVLTNLLASVDVKLKHWSQLVPNNNMSADI